MQVKRVIAGEGDEMQRGTAPHLPVLLWLALIATAGGAAIAREPKATAYLPRDEIVDNIIHFALRGDCQARRNIFGSAFVTTCKVPAVGGKVDRVQFDPRIHFKSQHISAGGDIPKSDALW